MKMVLFISGFTQTTKRRHGVFERFRWALNTRRALDAHGYRVELRTWRANWDAVAEYCRSLDVTEVCIAAYSWGVGRGVVQLAPQLQARGISVPWLVSCDGVFRGWGVSSVSRANPLNWRTLIHKGPLAPKIKIPSNVKAVYPLRQKLGRLRGHDFKIENSQQTRLHPTRWVDLPHGAMDDSVEFTETVGRLCLKLWERQP